MNKKLAIIGAGYLQRPLVLKAKAMGFEAICFAWETGAVCKNVADRFFPISIIEKEQILEVCREMKIDGIVSIASDLAVPTVNYVAHRLGLTANPDVYSGVTTDKYLMRECFAAGGVPSPAYMRVGPGDTEMPGFAAPWIVKPTDRSGSLGVEKVVDAAQLPRAIERACKASFSRQVIVEEFVSGREISVESISWQGTHHILAITDKVTTDEPFFVEIAHHQPSDLPANIQDRVKMIVLQALTALHIQNGASHSELKITEEGKIRVIEIGARMGGDFIGSDLVPLSTGYDFVKGVIQIALGIFTPPVLTRSLFSGVYFLCEATSSLLYIAQHATQFKEIVRAEMTAEKLHRVESSGERSGYIIYQAESRVVFPLVGSHPTLSERERE